MITEEVMLEGIFISAIFLLVLELARTYATIHAMRAIRKEYARFVKAEEKKEAGILRKILTLDIDVPLLKRLIHLKGRNAQVQADLEGWIDAYTDLYEKNVKLSSEAGSRSAELSFSLAVFFVASMFINFGDAKTVGFFLMMIIFSILSIYVSKRYKSNGAKLSMDIRGRVERLKTQLEEANSTVAEEEMVEN